tara:strand:+ start:356 stop:766 length:411 start_codon:yes stop_codon:yes gene_type:complete
MSLNKRHLAKTISWRIIGTTDTLILSWIISGDISIGISIGIIELFSKMILYYFHEKLWYNSNVNESTKRHIYKTFTWRVVGTLDTTVIGWLVSGDPIIGLKIGIVEVLSKMILYFLHEKLWYKINYGLISRLKKNQ